MPNETSVDAPSTRPVRLADVARYAGVSTATAARALSEKGYVHDDTRQRVVQAADALSYQPNLLARGLRSGKTSTVALLWSLAKLSPAGDILQKIALGLQEAGYTTHLVNALSDPKLTRKTLRELAQRKVDGLIFGSGKMLADSGLARLLRPFQAVVAAGSTPLPEIEYDCIYQNPTPAIRAMVEHFAAAGRRRLATLMPSGGNELKQRTFIEQAARLGCRVTTIEVRPRDREIAAEYFQRALETHLDGNMPDFDALFCVPDEGAARAMSCLRSLGCRVPEDIAIAGYNDACFAADLQPPLASIARHDDRLAAILVERILHRLEGDDNGTCDGPPLRREITMDFIPRASAGAVE